MLASTISSPWNPASTGPPADTNGSGSDTKNLDVGDIDDVSDVSVSSNFFCSKLGDACGYKPWEREMGIKRKGS